MLGGETAFGGPPQGRHFRPEVVPTLRMNGLFTTPSQGGTRGIPATQKRQFSGTGVCLGCGCGGCTGPFVRGTTENQNGSDNGYTPHAG